MEKKEIMFELEKNLKNLKDENRKKNAGGFIDFFTSGFHHLIEFHFIELYVKLTKSSVSILKRLARFISL